MTDIGRTSTTLVIVSASGEEMVKVCPWCTRLGAAEMVGREAKTYGGLKISILVLFQPAIITLPLGRRRATEW